MHFRVLKISLVVDAVVGNYVDVVFLFELLELMDENTQLVDPFLIDLSVSRACAIGSYFYLLLVSPLLYGD